MSGDGNNTPAATNPAPTTEPPPMKCPRCDSPNTKFCYYNNYTQSQPRYFCKACRRYWTKGGALRCVPVGGSGRRIKKTMKSARFADIGGGGGARRLGFCDGFAPPSPIGFQAGGLKIPSVNSSAAALIRQLSALPPLTPPPNPCFSLHQFDLFNNLSFPGGAQEMGNLAAPPQIQPLITIDQDLPHQQIQEPQPILFQNPEISTPPPQDTFGSSSRNAQDFLFDDFTFPSPVNTSGNGNGNGDEWEDLIQAWANSNEYNVFP